MFKTSYNRELGSKSILSNRHVHIVIILFHVSIVIILFYVSFNIVIKLIFLIKFCFIYQIVLRKNLGAIFTVESWLVSFSSAVPEKERLSLGSRAILMLVI